MAKVEFEGATAVLAADVRHLLRRTAAVTLFVSMIFVTATIFDALNGDWVAAGLDVGAGTGIFFAGYQTWKRQRRYSFQSTGDAQ